MRLILVLHRNGKGHHDESVGYSRMINQEMVVVESLLCTRHVLHIVILKTDSNL